VLPLQLLVPTATCGDKGRHKSVGEAVEIRDEAAQWRKRDSKQPDENEGAVKTGRKAGAGSKPTAQRVPTEGRCNVLLQV
jgi:hypothetical protein